MTNASFILVRCPVYSRGQVLNLRGRSRCGAYLVTGWPDQQRGRRLVFADPERTWFHEDGVWRRCREPVAAGDDWLTR